MVGISAKKKKKLWLAHADVFVDMFYDAWLLRGPVVSLYKLYNHHSRDNRERFLIERVMQKNENVDENNV